MRRCIIHIGTHKTGSTSLQRFFHANRRTLEGAGILYPVDGTEVAHHNLYREIAGKSADRRGATTLDRLSERLRGTACDVVILSSELFSTLTPDDDGPLRIAETASKQGFQVEATLFVRPQHALFNSMYAQRTKMLAEKERFHVYATRQQKRGNFDFAAVMKPWMSPPFRAPTAIPFTKAAIGGGIDAAFFEALGLAGRIESLGGLTPLVPVNFANGPKGVELCRRLSALGGPHHFGRAYLNVRRFAQRQARKRNWNKTSFVGLTDAMRDDIFDRYRASNEAFARRHWDTSWLTVFRADYERPYVPNEIGTADTAPESVGEVDAVYEMARDRFDPVRLAERSYPARILAGLAQKVDTIVGTVRERRRSL